MSRIKIEDLPVSQEMDQQELKGIFGGLGDLTYQKVREESSSLSDAKNTLGGTSTGIIAILIGL